MTTIVSGPLEAGGGAACSGVAEVHGALSEEGGVGPLVPMPLT